MKKVLSLMLALLLCLSLCACDGNGYFEDKKPEKNTIEEKLAGWWSCLNIYTDPGLSLNANGTEEYFGLKWSVCEDKILFTGTDKDGKPYQTEYQLRLINGQYIMIGQNETYVQYIENNADPLTYTEIATTLDNWDEYFELFSETYDVTNIWDEATQQTSYYLRLKPEYYQRLSSSQSNVVIHWAQSYEKENRTYTYSDTDTCGLTGAVSRMYGFSLMEKPITFEIDRIKGTLYLANF